MSYLLMLRILGMQAGRLLYPLLHTMSYYVQEAEEIKNDAVGVCKNQYKRFHSH